MNPLGNRVLVLYAVLDEPAMPWWQALLLELAELEVLALEGRVPW